MQQFDVYWVNLDPTIGAEIQKTRPCVIISPNELNHLNTRLIAPITSKSFNAPYRISLTLLDKKAKILCDQIRCISIQRFGQKITTLDPKIAQQLSLILCEMFAIE